MPNTRSILKQRFKVESFYKLAQGLWKSFYYLVFARRAYRFAVRPFIELGSIDELRLLCTGFPILEKCLPIRLQAGSSFGRKLLVLAAHPDDDTVGAGGTILQALASGLQVKVVYVTDGGSGGAGSYESNAAARRREADGLAERSGYEHVFLGAPDGEFPVTAELEEALARQIRDFAPGAVFLPWILEAHPSHRQMNRLLLGAYRRQPFDAPVYAYSVWSSVPANVFVDITGTMDAKIDAVSQWKSQTGLFDYPNYVRGMNGFYSYLQSGRGYAEPFFNLPARDYIALLSRYYGDARDFATIPSGEAP